MQLTKRFGTSTAAQTMDNGSSPRGRPVAPALQNCSNPLFSLPQAASEYISVSKVCGSVRLWPQPKHEHQFSLCGFQHQCRSWMCPTPHSYSQCRDLKAVPGRAQVPPRDFPWLLVSMEASPLSFSENKQAHTKSCLSTNRTQVEGM